MPKPITLAYLEKLEPGTIIPVFYDHYNVGRFLLKFEGLIPGDNFSDYKVLAAFKYEDSDWVGPDDYFYEFEGQLCRGSGAEPLFEGWPDLDELWEARQYT